VYSSILRLDTNHIDAHFNLGYIFLMTKDYESAIDHFSFVINQSRNHTSAFFSRGLSYKLIGNTDKAKADFLTTLELDSTFIEATNELKNMP
jgi:tetratricopeptide (TPR) repeat protein